MKIISQDYLPVRTFILIGMVLLTTTQTYAQNINTRLSFTPLIPQHYSLTLFISA